MQRQGRPAAHYVRWVSSAVVGRVVGGVARDVTAATVGRPCLVVAAHPDDETLGCGATIARKASAGTAVHLYVASDGASWPPGRPADENVATRAAELRRAAAALGVADGAVVQGQFPETELSANIDALTDAVADVVRAVRPEEVFTTSAFDPHADHAALARATRRAVAGAAVRVLQYPVWQWHRPGSWLAMLRQSSRPEAVRTAGFLGHKRRALAEYPSQVSLRRAGAAPHTIRPPLLRHFLSGSEVFFPLRG